MKCPYCSSKNILPGGMNESGIAVVGESPSNRDISEGVSFTGMYGQILRNEFNKAGLSFDLGIYTNLWRHKLSPGMYNDGKHFIWHRARLLEDIQDCPYILMLGTELAHIFAGVGVAEITGLSLKSIWLSPNTRITFLPLPSSVLHGGVGEFRLGISKFADETRSLQ